MALAHVVNPFCFWNADHRCSKLVRKPIRVRAFLGLFLAYNVVAALEASRAKDWKFPGSRPADDLLCSARAPVWDRCTTLLRSVTYEATPYRVVELSRRRAKLGLGEKAIGSCLSWESRATFMTQPQC